MKTLRLGKTGLTVTQLGLGGVQLAKITEGEAVRVVRTGLDSGVTFVETARAYWDSEEKIGKAVKGRRAQVVIASKAGAGSAAEMMQKIDESLSALGTDYIDLYQYHMCDTREAYEWLIKPGGALEGMRAAKEQGKIRAIGFSSHELNLALEMMADGNFDSAQVPISFVNTENHEKGLFDRARELHIGLIAMKPFGGGRLDNARLCMGYALGLRNVAITVGVDTVEHVRELVRLAENPPKLADEDRAEMERIKKELGTEYCRACNYCQPCPEGIKIYQVLWTPVYFAQMTADRVLTPEKIAMVRHAAACTACRQCETRCPFNLEIVENLKKCRAIVERKIAELGIEV